MNISKEPLFNACHVSITIRTIAQQFHCSGTLLLMYLLVVSRPQRDSEKSFQPEKDTDNTFTNLFRVEKDF